FSTLIPMGRFLDERRVKEIEPPKAHPLRVFLSVKPGETRKAATREWLSAGKGQDHGGRVRNCDTWACAHDMHQSAAQLSGAEIASQSF
ncbi:MAG: hypothetical protein RLN85_19680, partial [Pseudomonadales bacterium]